jgi:hypothetical protein
MLSYSLTTYQDVCDTLKSLLADDLEYIKTHPNPKYAWGNHSENLNGKFNQFEDLVSLPVFDKLIESGLELATINLYYVKPGVTKILYNTNMETKEVNNTSIIFPIDYCNGSGNKFTSYLWYNPKYVKRHHQMKDFADLYKTHGVKIVEDSHVFETNTPIIIKNQNAWAGIYNKEYTKDFVFLQITMVGNPDYDRVKSIWDTETPSL